MGEKVESSIKIIGALIALGGFLWGMFTYFDAREREAETRRIEATKSFLERQLQLYTEATQIAATLATVTTDSIEDKTIQRFWQLYWGELALVENADVEKAMVKFGQGLQNGYNKPQLQQLSLALAHACRESLAISWGINLWEKPSYSTDYQEQ
jgi:hypothetical protein